MSKEIKVYSTPTCPYCRMAKEFLDGQGMAYTEIDVAADSAAADEMIEKSGQMGVPVIVVGEEIVVGFDEEKIKAALAA